MINLATQIFYSFSPPYPKCVIYSEKVVLEAGQYMLMVMGDTVSIVKQNTVFGAIILAYNTCAIVHCVVHVALKPLCQAITGLQESLLSKCNISLVFPLPTQLVAVTVMLYHVFTLKSVIL